MISKKILTNEALRLCLRIRGLIDKPYSSSDRRAKINCVYDQAIERFYRRSRAEHNLPHIAIPIKRLCRDQCGTDLCPYKLRELTNDGSLKRLSSYQKPISGSEGGATSPTPR